MEKFLYRASFDTKERIANNVVAFMVDDTPLLPESISFIYNWVMTDRSEKTKAHYDIWDIVLKKYLPKKRPVLFRSCNRISKCTIQSFTGSMRSAERFADNHTGHLLICDTSEYLRFEDMNAAEHERSFFPLCECIKKGTFCLTPYFRESFYLKYAGEDEYIIRVNHNGLYDLKWNRKERRI